MPKNTATKDSSPALPAKIVESFFPITKEIEPGIIKISKVLRNQGIDKYGAVGPGSRGSFVEQH